MVYSASSKTQCVCVFSNQNTIPPYDSRISTAKLLIETEEFEVRFCTSPHTSVILPLMKGYVLRL